MSDTSLSPEPAVAPELTPTPDPVVAPEPAPTLSVTGTTPITIAIENEYTTKPWFSELLNNENPGEALLKQHDNLLTKLGQRPGAEVPTDPADEQKWEDFYSKVRPQEASEYNLGEFKLPEDNADEAKYKPVYEQLQAGMTDEYKSFLSGIMHKAGLTKAQADILAPAINSYSLEAEKALFDQQQEALQQFNAEFDALAAKELGPDKNKALAEANALLKKYVPDDIRKFNANLDNEALIQLALNIKHVMKQYGAEDGRPGGSTTSFGAQTIDQLNAEYQAWYADNHMILRDFTHPKHNAAMLKDQEYSERVRALTKR